ncbi:hypothetical protein CIHG_05428 [Coccidioides immitis H538.4]|uniref:Uncharacterized protein n=3 Tax=Coccidioides immitis TaxID=5501 RepID=A0A0J8R5U2_COCIT|nr:hypothetical protein CIRG_02220 [Coccidioides immitis RMSCC 2394]KMU79810.1 hypothetical protein CISG_08090 [Coccidioides immitis RMSCC 3703]KMU88257.1 hypothetical protein CIHG_05428 [Coccidioides immitis H538.4]
MLMVNDEIQSNVISMPGENLPQSQCRPVPPLIPHSIAGLLVFFVT